MGAAQAVKQVSIIVGNEPGTLARICRSLREEGINVTGFAAWGEVDHGVVRLVCDRPLKALDVLEATGMIAITREVLEVARDDRPGELLQLAEVLSAAGINIDYAYGSTSTRERGTMYLAVSDVAAARKVLKGS